MDYRELPKVELHCHLEACFRPQTIREIGTVLGLDIPQDPVEFQNNWLLTRPLDNLQVALERFVDIQRVWGSEEVIERLAFEACEDARAQNIRIMEFRYAPDFIAAGKDGLDFMRIHEPILRGIRRAQHDDLAVGLIGIVQKTLSLKRRGTHGRFYCRQRGHVCRHGLCRPGHASARDVSAACRHRAERRTGLTVHAGEEPGSAAQVRDAIEILGAQRIGHGIHIVNDKSVFDLVRERNVVLEVCPTSNWLTSSVPSTALHPIRSLMQAGIAVTVNSDDPGLFGIDLSDEYALLAAEHEYTAEEFMACNRLAARHSFIDASAKAAAWPEALRDFIDSDINGP